MHITSEKVMTERTIYRALTDIEGVSEFEERNSYEQDGEIYHHNFTFKFSSMRFMGTQISSPLFTLNKFNLPFRYTLKKATTRAAILDAINDYNTSRPIMKITLLAIKGKNVEVLFSSDFICEDSQIKSEILIPVVNIMAPSPSDFIDFLNEKKITISDK